MAYMIMECGKARVAQARVLALCCCHVAVSKLGGSSLWVSYLTRPLILGNAHVPVCSYHTLLSRVT